MVSVILKVLLVNLLAALGFANFYKIKNVRKIKKTLTRFYVYARTYYHYYHLTASFPGQPG